MSDGPLDPRWPEILSLTAHEVRNPLGAVAGYVRILLTDRVGPVTEKQRSMLEEMARVCGRISQVLNDVSTLSDLEDGTARFNRGPVDLDALLQESISALPDDTDRDVAVELSANGRGTLNGDAAQLRQALTAVLHALRRELVSSDRLCLRERTRTVDGRPVAWIAIAAPDAIDGLASADPAVLTVFDEWRGGCGLSLPVARRIIGAHGGSVWSPRQDSGSDMQKPSKASAVITLPLA